MKEIAAAMVAALEGQGWLIRPGVDSGGRVVVGEREGRKVYSRSLRELVRHLESTKARDVPRGK